MSKNDEDKMTNEIIDMMKDIKFKPLCKPDDCKEHDWEPDSLDGTVYTEFCIKCWTTRE